MVMLTALALAIVGLAFTTPSAKADCFNSSPETVFGAFGQEAAWETTCDGDGFYRGKIRDTLTDGSCVWVVYHDGAYTGTQGQACSSEWVTYRFWDQTGDSSATFQLCRRQGCSEFYGNFGY